MKIIPQHHNMVPRDLLYTGVTRGKKLIVLIAQEKAVSVAHRGLADPLIPCCLLNGTAPSVRFEPLSGVG